MGQPVSPRCAVPCGSQYFLIVFTAIPVRWDNVLAPVCIVLAISVSKSASVGRPTSGTSPSSIPYAGERVQLDPEIERVFDY